MVRMTKDQQVRTVAEGLALGTIALGVEAVSSSKLDLEFALAHAWRRWSRATDFPSIAGHKADNYLWIGIRRSERRRGVLAAWGDGRWLEPYITMGEHWTVEDCTEILEGSSDVSHDDWLELAGYFVDHLGAERVQRG